MTGIFHRVHTMLGQQFCVSTFLLVFITCSIYLVCLVIETTVLAAVGRLVYVYARAYSRFNSECDSWFIIVRCSVTMTVVPQLICILHS